MTSTAKRTPSRRRGDADITTDDFLGGRLKIVQPKSGHRAGSDALFLASAVVAREGERVLDVGAGVGVAGLCLLARLPHLEVTAVEIDPCLCAIAMSNAARNGMDDRFTVVEADVTARAAVLRASGLVREGYGHVIANPPFHAWGTVRAAPEPSRARAHVMDRDALSRWVRFLTTMAAPNGSLTLIHRADCLGVLLNLLEGRFGGIGVFPLFSKAGEPATRVIVMGRKGSRAPLRLLPGLVLHDAGGAYTAEAEAVLRGGRELRPWPSEKGRAATSGGKRQPSI